MSPDAAAAAAAAAAGYAHHHHHHAPAATTSLPCRELALQNRLRLLRDLEEQFDSASAPPVVAEKLRLAASCCSIGYEVMAAAPAAAGAAAPAAATAPPAKARRMAEAALLLLREGTVPSTPEVLAARSDANGVLACYYNAVRPPRRKAALLCGAEAVALLRRAAAAAAGGGGGGGVCGGGRQRGSGGGNEALASALASQCALLCSARRPGDGLAAAEEALRLCGEEGGGGGGEKGGGRRSRRAVEDEVDEEVSEGEEGEDVEGGRIGVSDAELGPLRAMCHHNIGVCLEMLGRSTEALDRYRGAFQQAYLSAPDGAHPLCTRLKTSFAEAYATAHSKKTKEHLRQLTRAAKAAPPITFALFPESYRQGAAAAPAPHLTKRYNLDRRMPSAAPRPASAPPGRSGGHGSGVPAPVSKTKPPWVSGGCAIRTRFGGGGGGGDGGCAQQRTAGVQRPMSAAMCR